MSQRIDSIYCFDYTREIGHYDSIRDFGSTEMTYIALALSTPKIRVNATPFSFDISSRGSSAIREYAISQLDGLKEISKNLAVNSPKYFLITYFDGSERYFAYNDSFYLLFKIALQFKPKEETNNEYVSPYALQSEPPTYVRQQQTSTPTSSHQTPKPQSQPVTQRTTTQKQEKSSVSWGHILAFVLLVIGIMGFVITFSPESTSNTINPTTPTIQKVELQPKKEPLSGAPLYGGRLTEGSKITINAAGGESCVVRLKSSTGTLLYSFYVRAGDTVTVTVPKEYMYVYFATGKTWYGEKYLFGENTSYSMDDDLLDFNQYTWEYTLYPVTNGNFQETPIDPEDF